MLVERGSMGHTIADVFNFTLGFTIVESANGTTVRQIIGGHDESHWLESV